MWLQFANGLFRQLFYDSRSAHIQFAHILEIVFLSICSNDTLTAIDHGICRGQVPECLLCHDVLEIYVYDSPKTRHWLISGDRQADWWWGNRSSVARRLDRARLCLWVCEMIKCTAIIQRIITCTKEKDALWSLQLNGLTIAITTEEKGRATTRMYWLNVDSGRQTNRWQTKTKSEAAAKMATTSLFKHWVALRCCCCRRRNSIRPSTFHLLCLGL